jgi:hypothetical protein
MTYVEKNIFIKLITLSFLMIYFLFKLYFMYVEERFDIENLSDLWISLISAAVVILIFATILAQVLPVILHKIKTGEKKQEEKKIEDERDKLIDLKVTKITHCIFTIGTFIAMCTFTLGKPATIMFTILIFVGLVSHIIGDIIRLWLYKRGF